VRFVSGTAGELPADVLLGVGRYRNQVFVKKLGWQLECRDSLEYDQFDRDDTVYVVAQNDAGEIIGTARLLSTARPYLLSEIFPQLLHGLPAPASNDVFELSRFAAVDFTSSSGRSEGQFSSATAVGLLKASLRCAVEHGAKRVITVSPVGVERLLRAANFRAHRAGPPVLVDKDPLFACWIHCEASLADANHAGRPMKPESAITKQKWSRSPEG